MPDNDGYAVPPWRVRRARRSDRYLSAGLAGVACVGLVAAIGTRTISDNLESAQDLGSQAGSARLAADSVAISSSGLTETQLDAYAAQLRDEAARLDAYRDELVSVAAALKTLSRDDGAAALAAAPEVVSTPKPAPKPVAKPAPKQRPQATTKSS